MKRAYRPRPPLSRPVAAPAQLGSPRRGALLAGVASLRWLARSRGVRLCRSLRWGTPVRICNPLRPPLARRCAPLSARSLARSRLRAFMSLSTLGYARADMQPPTPPARSRLPSLRPPLACRPPPLAALGLRSARSRLRAFMPLSTLGYARADMQPPTPPARSLRFGRGQIPARSRDGSLRA
jgi:hypothetical protein